MKMNPKIFIFLIVIIILGTGGFLVWKNIFQPKIEKSVDELRKASTENMVLIPAGAFNMGRENRDGWSPMADPQQFNDELPLHEVYVDAFYIDKYETTNRQFKEFVDATGYVTEAERNGGASEVMVPANQADTPIQGPILVGNGWKEQTGVPRKD